MPVGPRQPTRVTGTAQTLLEYARHAMRVLGKGHTERVYHRALATSLGRTPIQLRSEVVTPIMFMGECVGLGRADLVLQGRQRGPRDTALDLVVEIKANARPPAQASGQLRKYIESLRKIEKRECAGVVLNFNQTTGDVDIYIEPDDAAGKAHRPPPVKRSRFFATSAASMEKELSTARATVARLEKSLQLAHRRM